MRAVLTLCLIFIVFSQKMQAHGIPGDKENLVVLWVSGDLDVAEKSCLMYTHAAKQNAWFDEVVLIVWGPSARLLAENEELQDKIKAMEQDGVVLEACVACADMLGVVEELKKLGVEVKGMGEPLSGYLKSGYYVLTY